MKKYVRFCDAGGDCYGLVDGDVVHRLRGDCPDSFVPTGESLLLSALTLLPPCSPGKIIGTGLNYRDVALAPGERDSAACGHSGCHGGQTTGQDAGGR